MNWEKKIESLAVCAQADEPPRVDVAPAVLRMLLSDQAEPVTIAEKLWIWLAAVASAVAVPTAVVAIAMYNTSSMPLRELVDSIAWAI